MTDETKYQTFGLSLTENQRRFLGQVLDQPGKRRHEIAEDLGFSPQTAMRVVAPLVQAGVLVEIDEVTGARGKPPKLVHFAKSSLITIAFVIARERVTVSACDLQGSVIVRETERREFQSCREQVNTVARLFRTIREALPPHTRVVSAAATVTGFFLERGRRIVARIDPVGWSQLDLRDWLEDLAGVPVFVENDGRVLATTLLETTHHRTFLTVFLDSGIGGAIVEDGRLVHGKHGNAGAIGRFLPHDATRPTERSLRRALGVTDWDDWKGSATLSGDARRALDTWLDDAASLFSHALSLALALLDFEAVYVCARIPQDLLDQLVARIRFEPLGANIPAPDGAPRHFVLEPPAVIARPISDMAGMTHVLASRSFLDPEIYPAESAGENADRRTTIGET